MSTSCSWTLLTAYSRTPVCSRSSTSRRATSACSGRRARPRGRRRAVRRRGARLGGGRAGRLARAEPRRDAPPRRRGEPGRTRCEQAARTCVHRRAACARRAGRAGARRSRSRGTRRGRGRRGVVVVGLTERWRRDGLGRTRTALATKRRPRRCSYAAVSGPAASPRGAPRRDSPGRLRAGARGESSLTAPRGEAAHACTAAFQARAAAPTRAAREALVDAMHTPDGLEGRLAAGDDHPRGIVADRLSVRVEGHRSRQEGRGGARRAPRTAPPRHPSSGRAPARVGRLNRSCSSRSPPTGRRVDAGRPGNEARNPAGNRAARKTPARRAARRCRQHRRASPPSVPRSAASSRFGAPDQQTCSRRRASTSDARGSSGASSKVVRNVATPSGLAASARATVGMRVNGDGKPSDDPAPERQNSAMKAAAPPPRLSVPGDDRCPPPAELVVRVRAEARLRCA